MTKAELNRVTRQAAMLMVLATVFAVFSVCPTEAGTIKKNDWRIKIKSAAVVNSPRVKLGDIAEFYGDLPDQTREELSGVELWNAPERGKKPMRINRSQLRVILKHYLGDLISNCILPSTLSIQAGGKVMSGEELRRTVVKVLTTQAEAYGGDYKFRDFKLPEYLFYSDTMDSLRVHSPHALKAGNNSFRLEIVSVDGRVLRSLSGGVFMDLWKPVPCPVKPLNRKEVITPDLITWKNSNMAYLGDRAWDGKGGPWRIKVPVGTGQPIMKSSIEPAPVISRGDKVRLLYEGKNLKLTVPVESMEDGGVGEMITVRNLQSKRKVIATVIDAQTVKIR